MVASVLSGNRNFEGRINPDVRANYLMSPPLVVAFALAGRIDIDLRKDPIGNGKDGKPVYLADLWPTQREVEETMENPFRLTCFGGAMARCTTATSTGAACPSQGRDLYLGKRFHIHPQSTVFRWHDAEAVGGRGHQERSRAGGARRQRYHRSHFTSGFDQER